MEIDQELLEVMDRELAIQCRFALYRLRDAEQIEQRMPPIIRSPDQKLPPELEDPLIRERVRQQMWELLHLGVHDFLIHAANVAKIFFPETERRGTPEERARRTTRGNQLRAAYGINDTMEIANRALRNDLEHFDERLEQWFSERGRTHDAMFDFNLMIYGTRDPGAVNWDAIEDRWRGFGEPARYTFRGRSYDLRKARQELEAILKTANDRIQAGRRSP